METYPYEGLSHAALAWLKSNLALCDVIHVHEWGGVFVDVITASAYRQLKPGVHLPARKGMSHLAGHPREAWYFACLHKGRLVP